MDDFNHPPHIHNLDVVCSKTMMTINIEFNRVFDGVIYSKVNTKHSSNARNDSALNLINNNVSTLSNLRDTI